MIRVVQEISEIGKFRTLNLSLKLENSRDTEFDFLFHGMLATVVLSSLATQSSV